MAESAPRGTRDILPDETPRWHRIEQAVRDVCGAYGYSEIRTPIFEHTEIFARGIGEATDIVEKEMYTFEDRGGRSLTLRPEGTAGVVRAFIEHNLYAKAQPTKVYYMGPMFRYERPQKGRYRQFHQFGVEAFGSSDPALDAEVISIPVRIYGRLGIDKVKVFINSIGCPTCRARYREKLREVYRDRLGEVCESCRRRYDRNPLRLLDCKEQKCRAAVPEVPSIIDYLCDECAAHFEAVKSYLDILGLDYEINPRLVRGLDYYTKTVFEYTLPGLGAQDAAGGGGRYDGLVELYGGPSTPGVGFASGMERLVLALEALEGNGGEAAGPGLEYFVVYAGDDVKAKAFAITSALRGKGIAADMDVMARSFKAQLKYASRIGARRALIIGGDEVQRGVVVVKDMATGQQEERPLSEFEG